ncbi:hypothetical protein [Paraburkholderia acidiphila]|uniref:CopG-like ribbon-helix-helix domain-containing protein n=1 Tax=Paraburkholderia acidiphila TaxID=2571747 RepID=A0A7Z2JB61_9BURK|nr:hypothetical protein [Paraburkholderia acidiphila]QGZ57174.1 hypothetical protein FAZ97_19805 [Paraburkholderia acidiphila]
MGEVIQLKRRKPREPKARRRRITVSMADPLLARVEAAAKQAGVSPGVLMCIGVAQLLAQHEREVRARNANTNA